MRDLSSRRDPHRRVRRDGRLALTLLQGNSKLKHRTLTMPACRVVNATARVLPVVNGSS
jgi:hypothetical protein